MKKDVAIAYLLLTVTSVIFGFSFLVTRDALEALGVFQLLGLRFLAAALVMTALVATGVVKLHLNRAKLKLILPLALLQPLIYFTGETLGIQLTSATESGIMIALIPIAIALFSGAVAKERLTGRQWISVVVSVAGVALIVAAQDLIGSGSIPGYLLLLAAVTAEGLYCSLARKVSVNCSPFEITFVMIWTGAVAFNVIGVSTAAADGTIAGYITAALQPGVLSGILYLGILSSTVAYFGVNYALSKIKASSTAGFANLTTVVSVLAGVMLGGEPLAPLQIVGIVLILLSIWGIAGESISRKKKTCQEPVQITAVEE